MNVQQIMENVVLMLFVQIQLGILLVLAKLDTLGMVSFVMVKKNLSQKENKYLFFFFYFK